MTEQRAPQESVLSLKDQLAVQLSVLFGEYTMTQCQNAAESLIPIVEAQLAGAVPQEELREKIAKLRVSALNYSKSIGSISVALAREINALADELESLAEKWRGE